MIVGFQILPCKGRGTTQSVVEGYHPLDSAIPLRQPCRLTPPLAGEVR